MCMFMVCEYRNVSNNLNRPIIIPTPPSVSRKNIIIAFEHPRLFQYLNTYTLWSSNGGVLAFDSLSGAAARITERLPAYYRRFGTSTRLLQSVPNIY